MLPFPKKISVPDLRGLLFSTQWTGSSKAAFFHWTRKLNSKQRMEQLVMSPWHTLCARPFWLFWRRTLCFQHWPSPRGYTRPPWSSDSLFFNQLRSESFKNEVCVVILSYSGVWEWHEWRQGTVAWHWGSQCKNYVYRWESLSLSIDAFWAGT